MSNAPARTAPGQIPERDECIEQTYFFRIFRERIAQNISAQDVLARVHDEVLVTTKLPFAIQYLSTELKHSGLLGDGFARLPHYFTPFQTFVIRQAEAEGKRFTIPVAFLILEREAAYKAGEPTQAGLFVYQLEAITRNRLGYDAGLRAIGGDPFYGPAWVENAEIVRRQIGVVDLAELVYLRSDTYVADERRDDPAYQPSLPPLFGEKEGRIARASIRRDPLFLFAALQRQLNYPEVPRLVQRDDVSTKIEMLQTKVRDLEARLRILESEQRGTFDPTQFGKPDMFRDRKDDEDQ
ncbi:MAG: hypothetical protein LC104_01905 [Bacteroidales bacterium]|nr:hypothetical protein [Bacteroidales bacterium]